MLIFITQSRVYLYVYHIIRFLLSLSQTTGWSALMLAAINNQKEVVTLLLQHGAKKDTTDISKRTAVQLATVLGHREAALALDDKKTGETLSGIITK